MSGIEELTGGPGAVRLVLEDDSGRVLFLHRASDDAWAPGSWELPGGGIDSDESVVVAAARELSEETALVLDEAREIARYARVEPDGTPLITAYVVGRTSGVLQLSDEHQDGRWLPLADAPEQITKTTRIGLALLGPAPDR